MPRFASIQFLSRRAKMVLGANRIDVSALFSSEWYNHLYPDVRENGIDPYKHFMSVGWAEERSPHPLFDTEWYLSHNPDVEQSAINPLVHFITTGWQEGRNPHPLFDVNFYLAQNPDIESAQVNPLIHYVQTGWKEGRTPNAYFDPAAAQAATTSQTGRDPLTDYLFNGGNKMLCPHANQTTASVSQSFWSAASTLSAPTIAPLTDYKISRAASRDIEAIRQSGEFDEAWYLATYPDIRHAGMDPIVHYVLQGAEEKRNPNATFSTELYLEANEDIVQAGINPFAHWVSYGKKEGRNIAVVYADPPAPEPDYCPEIIFTSHDASLSGAPMVLLALLRWVKDNTRASFSIVVGAGGPLSEKFEEIAPTLFLDKLSGDGEAELRRFCGGHVHTVYLNTIASGRVAKRLDFLSAAFFCHVHEMESVFEVFADDFELIKSRCQNFIAVSKGTKEALERRIDPTSATIHMLRPFIEPYDPSKGTMTAPRSGTKTIYGCGTCGERKGFDLFCDVAAKLREAGTSGFVMRWIGSPEHEHIRPEEIIRAYGVEGLVEFLGPSDYPRAEFVQGDIFFLPSREDPFPLVCLEAAECGLPVVCFDAQAGDMYSFVEQDAGIVVPYLDTDAAAQEIASLLNDDAHRAALGACARQKVQDQFYVDQAGEKILSLLPALESDRSEDAPAAFKRMIDSCQAVSFDIFDTLVARRISDPDVVFDILEHQISHDQPAPIPFFRERMNTAGQTLAQKNGEVDDVSIDEIYANMPFFTDPDLEKTIERKVCIPHRTGIDLYDYAKAQGKKVYLSSDMYLDRETVELILRDNGISDWDDFFLSSDIGRKKDTGRLYEHLKEIAAADGITPDQILHIGDNWIGDIREARKAGVRAVRITPLSEKVSPIVSLSTDDRDTLSQSGRIWESFCTQSTRLWRLKQPGLSSDVLLQIGFELTGPFASMLAMYARQIAEAQGINKIVFMARDGRIVKTAFDTLFQSDIQEGSIDSTYLHLSRATVVPATLEHPLTPNDLYFLIDGLHLAQKPVSYFLERAGLNTQDPDVKRATEEHFPSVDHVPSWQDLTKLTNMFRALSANIYAANAGHRAAFAQYLEQNGILDTDKILVVDVGWLLNIQSRLGKFLTSIGAGTKVRGCYVGSRDRTDKSIPHHCLMFDKGEPPLYDEQIGKHVTLFELLFSAPEASASGIVSTQDVASVLFKANPAPLPNEFIAAQTLQMGAEAFLEYLQGARRDFFPDCISPDFIFKKFNTLAQTHSDFLKATLNGLKIKLGGNHEFDANEPLIGNDPHTRYLVRQPSEYFPPAPFHAEHSQNRTLIVTSAGTDNGSTRYRSFNLADSLRRAGFSSTVIHAATPLSEAKALIADADTILFQRCFQDQGNVGNMLSFAKDTGKRCLAEIDDLVLPEFVSSIGSVAGGQWDLDMALNIAGKYEGMLKCVDACIVSTPCIQQEIQRLYGLPCEIFRNKISPDYLKGPKPSHAHPLRLAYASGTYSHKEDFALIEETLYAFLQEHADVQLDILGAAQVSERLLALPNVRNYPLLAYPDMLDFISRRDVMLVPLVDNIFNRAKSTVKFVECGSVGVPVIASDVGEFSSAIQDGQNGLLAKTAEAWRAHLEMIYKNPDRLAELGANAHATITESYTTEKLESAIVSLVCESSLLTAMEPV